MVCVGNVCRSPMAEVVLARALEGRSPPVSVASAGIAALVGRSAEPLAQELVRERGLDLSGHRARQLTPGLLADHDLILVMEEGHRRAVERMHPPARGRVHRLGRYGGFDVPDPYGGARADFERALALIDAGLADYTRRFWSAPR